MLPNPELVIFDVDGTIIDHEKASTMALKAVRTSLPEFAGIGLQSMEQKWSRHFPKLWKDVMEGNCTIEETRIKRFQWILEEAGMVRDPHLALKASMTYGNVYDRSISAVPGADSLMRRIREMGINIALLTNNTKVNQVKKLRKSGLAGLYSFMLTSEEAGISKPDPAIFKSVLDRYSCPPEKALMIGNSLEDDVLGALNAGIKPVWFNRFRTPDRDSGLSYTEIKTFLPADEVMKALFSGI